MVPGSSLALAVAIGFFGVLATSFRVKSTAETVDVTSMVVDRNDAWRCCCDKEENPKWWTSDKSTHSGVCKVFKENGFKCKSKQEDSASWGATGQIHNYKNTIGGKCSVSVSQASELFGDGYCQTSSPKLTGRLGDKVKVSCDTGYEPEHAEVSCDLGLSGPGKGFFNPQPKCNLVHDYCPLTRADFLRVPVSAAAFGHQEKVHCVPGYEPELESVMCGEDRKFAPTPKCKEQPEWCTSYADPTNTNGMPTVKGPVEHLAEATVTCVAGYEPVQTTVTCNSERTFEPKPACSLIADYCMSRTYRSKPGTPSVPDAALGKEVTVTCAEGFVPVQEHLDCMLGGSYSQKPECRQAVGPSSMGQRFA